MIVKDSHCMSGFVPLRGPMFYDSVDSVAAISIRKLNCCPHIFISRSSSEFS